MTDYPPGSSIAEGGISVMGDNLFCDTGTKNSKKNLFFPANKSLETLETYNLSPQSDF